MFQTFHFTVSFQFHCNKIYLIHNRTFF